MLAEGEFFIEDDAQKFMRRDLFQLPKERVKQVDGGRACTGKVMSLVLSGPKLALFAAPQIAASSRILEIDASSLVQLHLSQLNLSFTNVLVVGLDYI